MAHFPRIHFSGNPQSDSTGDPENFTRRIIFMSMSNDIIWNAKGNDELGENNLKTFLKKCCKIPSRSLVFHRAWI